MTIHLATASWEELLFSTVIIGAFLAGFWLFTRFWERMWLESLQSRAVDRRFLRWQRSFFRGRYPLGHWRKPGSIPSLQATMFLTRAVIILLGLVWLIALGSRLFK